MATDRDYPRCFFCNGRMSTIVRHGAKMFACIACPAEGEAAPLTAPPDPRDATIAALRDALRGLVEQAPQCEYCPQPATQSCWRDRLVCDMHAVMHGYSRDLSEAPALRAALAVLEGTR